MHSDIHLLLHTYRAAELQHEAAELNPPRRPLRQRMGWTMVELGLRLAQAPPRRAARAA
ncbi:MULTISPECIES: hypothetical protein [unclassified Streptomyces]|uniref:hypothetical protein n=1 Tax=unclassified Streptomyces TaxID=2593676 RepID=UPI000B303221|nr:hypothetical protein [Streptomyces sp. CB02058]